MLLHLRDLLDLRSSPTVLPLSLSHHVESKYRPTEIYYLIHFGGPARGRTGVHSAFTTKGLQQFFKILMIRPTMHFDQNAKQLRIENHC